MERLKQFYDGTFVLQILSLISRSIKNATQKVYHLSQIYLLQRKLRMKLTQFLILNSHHINIGKQTPKYSCKQKIL